MELLTTFLHETKQIIKELFSLFIIIQFIQLKQTERNLPIFYTHIGFSIPVGYKHLMIGYVSPTSTPQFMGV